MAFSLHTATAKHEAHTTTARKYQEKNDEDDDNPFIYISRKHDTTLALLFKLKYISMLQKTNLLQHLT